MTDSHELQRLFRGTKLMSRDIDIAILMDYADSQDTHFEDLTMSEAREMSNRLLNEINRFDVLRQALHVTRTRLNNMVGREV